MNSSGTTRRTVRQMTFLQTWQTPLMNSSRTTRRTIRQMTFFASPANNVHEQFANISPNCSPNDLFLPSRRTMFVKNSRTIRRIVCQMTSLEILANIVHEHQLYYCSRTTRRTIRQTDNTEVKDSWRALRSCVSRSGNEAMAERRGSSIVKYSWHR